MQTSKFNIGTYYVSSSTKAEILAHTYQRVSVCKLQLIDTKFVHYNIAILQISWSLIQMHSVICLTNILFSWRERESQGILLNLTCFELL